MLDRKKVAVVIPAYNEEKQIKQVIRTLPKFVDFIIVVNDHSKDSTADCVKDLINNENKRGIRFKLPTNININNKSVYLHAENVVNMLISKEDSKLPENEIISTNSSRLILINHTKNFGVGAAIASGYRWCRDRNIDCTAIVAGDGQMDPGELESICRPVVNGEVDYVKANRLKHRSAFFVIPKIRFFGNSILSLFTKIASGYWRISDTQAGYTAISLSALKAIRLHKIYHSYGCPNDILVKLNIAYCTVKEVESKPVYNIGEKSKMNELKVVPRISWLLFKLFWTRLYVKYLFRDFHPLFLLYNLAILILLIDLPISFVTIRALLPEYRLPLQYLLMFIFLSISGFQLLFFAMWMDMQDNENLQK